MTPLDPVRHTPPVDATLLVRLDAPLTAADYAGYAEDAWGALISYLHGDGDAETRAATAHRLACEPAYAAAAASLRAVWHPPLPSPTVDVQAGLARLRAAMAKDTEAASATIATRVRTRIPPPVSHRERPRWSRARWGALAAAALIAWVGARVVQRPRGPAFYYHGGPAGQTVRLPDGTQATLAPGSYLGTAPGFPHGTRVVFLYGGAHFTVAHDPRVPFLVRTLGVGARVLGTTFAVQADTSLAWRVQVEQGKVSLVVPDGAGHWRAVETLTAGEAVHLTLALAWMARAGADMAGTGVPVRTAFVIQRALRRASIRLGAAAARDRAHDAP